MPNCTPLRLDRSKEIARVQKFVDRFRYQANKASQVQSRLKQLEKVKRIEIQRIRSE